MVVIRLILVSLCAVSYFALNWQDPVMKMQSAIEEIGKHGDFLPNERGITLPIINTNDGQLVLIRLIYFTRTVNGEGTHITPPQYLASVDLRKQEFRSIAKFPEDLQPSDLPKFPWIHNRARFEKPEQIIAEYHSIYELYDRLIPPFIDRQLPVTDATIKDAKAYLSYFDKHAEKPLLPYYEKLGGEFLKWVRQTSTR